MMVLYAVLEHFLDKRMVEADIPSDDSGKKTNIDKAPMMPLVRK